MRPKFILLLGALIPVFFSCNGVDFIDDYVPPSIRITTQITTLTLGSSVALEASYFNNVGVHIQAKTIEWKSLHPEIIQINAEGTASPLQEGQAELIAQTTTEEGDVVLDTILITIVSNVVFENEDEVPIDHDIEGGMQNSSVSPTLRILNSIIEISANTSYQLEIFYQDENGVESHPETLLWTSSDQTVIDVNEKGTLTAIGSGTATITVSLATSNTLLFAQNFITVTVPELETVTSFSGNLVTKSGYTLEGGFTLSITETGLQLSLGEDYKASTTLPGLYVYLSNNNNTTSQAYEIGPVKVFTGSHSYDLPSSIGLMDYQYILYWCKPFNVKVGEAKIYD